jgi:[amino group carrier protein]-lysine/ornithine hydrolase
MTSTRSIVIPERQDAIDLLHGLVAIPSTSRNEAEASAWLVSQMQQLSYDRAFVDAAGNAVGEIGSPQADRTMLLLGHIDTVPGNIPVRIEEGEAGPLLYGRGSVDAKGPLATFTMAAARIGSAWAHEKNLRIVVVGAVEEEAATSKGARFIADRFDGIHEPKPDACIIGEPSGWQRITLGYKGRLLVELEASQPMAHTAGPDRGVATVAVDFWNWLTAYTDRFNQGREKTFDQLLPSLRDLQTWTDDAMHDWVRARTGTRLPLGFDPNDFVAELGVWAASCVEAASPPVALPAIGPGDAHLVHISGARTEIYLNLLGYEPAWRSDRSTSLARAFLAGIRSVSDERPGYLVKTGTSDMNVVGPAWGCPIVAYGPGDSSLDHTPHEHIQLDEYWQAVQVMEETLRHWS